MKPLFKETSTKEAVTTIATIMIHHFKAQTCSLSLLLWVDDQYKINAAKLALTLHFGTFYEFLELQFINVCDTGIKCNLACY